MTDLNDLSRRYGLSLIAIAALIAAAVACWIFALPLWLLVLTLVILFFAIIGLLGDLGLFGGRDTD